MVPRNLLCANPIFCFSKSGAQPHPTTTAYIHQNVPLPTTKPAPPIVLILHSTPGWSRLALHTEANLYIHYMITRTVGGEEQQRTRERAQPTPFQQQLHLQQTRATITYLPPPYFFHALSWCVPPISPLGSVPLPISVGGKKYFRFRGGPADRNSFRMRWNFVFENAPFRDLDRTWSHVIANVRNKLV